MGTHLSKFIKVQKQQDQVAVGMGEPFELELAPLDDAAVSYGRLELEDVDDVLVSQDRCETSAVADTYLRNLLGPSLSTPQNTRTGYPNWPHRQLLNTYAAPEFTFTVQSAVHRMENPTYQRQIQSRIMSDHLARLEFVDWSPYDALVPGSATQRMEDAFRWLEDRARGWEPAQKLDAWDAGRSLSTVDDSFTISAAWRPLLFCGAESSHERVPWRLERKRENPMGSISPCSPAFRRSSLEIPVLSSSMPLPRAEPNFLPINLSLPLDKNLVRHGVPGHNALPQDSSNLGENTRAIEWTPTTTETESRRCTVSPSGSSFSEASRSAKDVADLFKKVPIKAPILNSELLPRTLFLLYDDFRKVGLTAKHRAVTPTFSQIDQVLDNWSKIRPHCWRPAWHSTADPGLPGHAVNS